MEDSKPSDISSSGSSNKVTRLRGRSLPDTCKLVYGKALELSKYDHFESGSVMKKGHIFVGKKSIPLDEYRKHVNNLLDVFDQLGIQYATSVSQYLRKQYPESDKVLQKLKSFYAQLEAKISTPLKSAEDSDGQSQVFMFESSTKFQTMEAVFTGKDIEEAYDDDRFQLQCEEIEILLSGGQRTRDVGQEEEIKQLTQLLQGLERNGGISGPVHRQSRPGQTAMNTARGGTVPNTARTMGPGSFPSAHNMAFDPARVGPGAHHPTMASITHERPSSVRVPNAEALLPPSSLT
eukprot:GGOE01013624.1.p1 GENE.GGOE01013624.1~~GGOE01013624.1.p1  ORF type:complete len:292 (-),score=28.24 GGOE01013624.1:142-1017(-)